MNLQRLNLGTEYFELFEINETKLGKKWKKKFKE